MTGIRLETDVRPAPKRHTAAVPGRRLLDIALAVAVTVGCVLEVWAPAVFGSTHPAGPRLAVFAAYVVGCACLLVRRTHALLAATVTYLSLVLEWTVFGSPEGFGVLALLVLPAYSVGAHEERSRALAGLAAGLAAGVVWDLRDPASTTVNAHVQAAVWLFPVVIGWLLGAYLRTRRMYVAGLRDRADAAEREKEERAAAAAAAERTRIARELHDIVAHNVSVMVVQAEAAEEMLDRDRPDRARVPVRKVQDTGRSALGDMRRLLGVLRDADGQTSLTPQPGVANLDVLLSKVRDAGLRVELEVQGEPEPLPPAVDLSAYRIVQEALTNSLKYAGTAQARVVVRFSRGAVELEIMDDGTGPAGDSSPPGEAATSGGHGLIGMRERVALYGGTLNVGRRPSGGYLVQARLPLADVVP
jgi:signal transduction histidine kinase